MKDFLSGLKQRIGEATAELERQRPDAVARINALADAGSTTERGSEPNPRNSHSQAEREALYFAATMRVLDREMPGYAE